MSRSLEKSIIYIKIIFTLVELFIFIKETCFFSKFFLCQFMYRTIICKFEIILLNLSRSWIFEVTKYKECK